jgi:serine/threonine protein kinase
LKLLDFGIAKYGSSEVQTQHHTVKGKPAYLAPEVIEGLPFDARADLFSLGVVLHEMLTLVPLFASDNDMTTLRKVLAHPVVPPSELRDDVPPALDAIVMKAVERDPARRYTSAAEMARDLDELVVSSHLSIDDVVAFLAEAQPLINPPPRSAEARIEETMPTEPEGEPTKRDLALRLRMSPLGRLLFGRHDR